MVIPTYWIASIQDITSNDYTFLIEHPLNLVELDGCVLEISEGLEKCGIQSFLTKLQTLYS
ncbi:hypothetical protein DEO72_LG5g972 [Vigna unguiculata]|uniref:Uncharacterized protein n=1 Tax=Vigna unguiculata TaxID=3917 RepID=A0A4D6LWP6_VIGUN|nr:hypothetical protein DEO72_LG5g972 [Vigna unguiculata]